ncbi:MAG TPA: efflux RND transporter periplasmic adaptor subunit [Candidatus Eisenbacteria bacterium]|nr:efflux RND transporter periplasmic adaptor subunit [Candidatus Eisenbacteria bacterium]
MPRWTTRLFGSLAAVTFVAAGCQSTDRSADATAGAQPGAPAGVSALGRIEPKDGILRIAGPSRPSAVIAKLYVEEGDRVKVDQPIADLDTMTADEAAVTKAKAALRNAEAELGRLRPLIAQRIVSQEALDNAQLHVDTARADLVAAQAVLDLDVVRAPVAGQIVQIFARRGERVGPGGIAELAQTDEMFVVAEVYETDIGRVKVGQQVSVKSPAFEGTLTGKVDRIGMKIGKQDVLGTDPVAKTDSRVVEVRVKLDEAKRAAGLSHLQVEVAIQP